jgi:hypothetical protein
VTSRPALEVFEQAVKGALDDREELSVVEHRGEAFVEAAGRRVLGGDCGEVDRSGLERPCEARVGRCDVRPTA